MTFATAKTARRFYPLNLIFGDAAATRKPCFSHPKQDTQFLTPDGVSIPSTFPKNGHQRACTFRVQIIKIIIRTELIAYIPCEDEAACLELLFFFNEK